jgi:RimJ/RimL family protein N-acetyltransferase
MTAVDPPSGALVGGGTLHHFDAERSIVEIGYWVLREARGRVLERAGFTREGVVRSMPVPSGARVDKTLFSLLPGDARP